MVLVVRCSLLDARCSVLFVGWSLQDACCVLFVAGCSRDCRMATVEYSFWDAHSRVLTVTVHCRMLIIGCSVSRYRMLIVCQRIFVHELHLS